MSSELRELYQQVILDHNKQPRNFHAMEDPTVEKQGKNPLCGDQVTVYLKMDGNRIADLSFTGQGCAISKASASMMTAELKGKTLPEAEAIFEKFHALVTDENADIEDESLGKLAVFGGVREFPARVKCASLAWHTVHAALHHNDAPVSTE